MPAQPVLDFHVRLAPAADALDRLLGGMDRCGIDRAVVCAGGTIDLDRLSEQLITGEHVETDADNKAVLAAACASSERLVPFFFANPHRDPAVYQSQAARYRGLELSPAVHGVALNDERCLALVRVAGKAGHPVYVVCIDRPGCDVAALVELAQRFEAVTFVLGHSGIGNIDLYAINLLRRHRNIFMETSGGYTCVVRAALERLGPDRVLFGSEYPLQHPSVELAKFTALELTAQCWAQVAWHNAHRLLRQEA